MIIGNRLYRLNEPLKIWFEPRDIWVGVYWKHKDIRGEMFITDVYVCLLPMLPILISVVAWRRSAQQSVQADGAMGIPIGMDYWAEDSDGVYRHHPAPR